MEPDVVSNQPKINRNTFKIGSGDLQEQVANNTKRIRVISTMLKSSRRRGSEGLNPKATNIQQSLEQSNLILADIAIQLQQDFQDRKQAERLKLTKNREEQLELRRTNKEQDIEYKKTEKKITKSSKKIKGPLASIFNAIGKILMLFGGLVLLKTLLTPGTLGKIYNSEQFQNAKAALESTFSFLTENMKGILVVGAAFVGLKLAAVFASIFATIKGVILLLANPILLAGIGVLMAAGMQGLGKSEKEVLKELENMGGYSKENRDQLIAKLKEQKENLSPLERIQGVGREIDARILFLEKGLYGQGLSEENKKQFDWSKLDGVEELGNFENFMLNFETDTTNMNNDLVRKNNNNNITTVELEGETIDLTQKNNNSNVVDVSDLEANQVTLVSSVDTSNRYVNEFPITAGFNESVYA